MNFISFTLPPFKKKQIVTTEGNKGREDQSFVDFVSFCLEFPFMAGAVLLFGLVTSVQDPFTYTTNNSTLTITGYTGSVGAVTIPNIIDGLPVTDIGTNAFYGYTDLTNVVLDNSLISIGAHAFSGPFIFGLSLGGSTFACSLTSITVPASVTNIGEGAFLGCPLASAYFLGNAPAADGTVFLSGVGLNIDNATAYYLPGTTGWAEFASNTRVPTALWTLPYP